MGLIRYQKYGRKDLHNMYSPEQNFVEGAGKWGLHGIVSIPDTKRDFVFFVTNLLVLRKFTHRRWSICCLNCRRNIFYDQY